MGEEKIVVVGMERGLRVTLRGLLIFLGGLMGVGALLRWDRIGNLDDVRWRVVLTVVGLAVAAWLGGIWARAGQRFVKTAKVSGAAIAFSFCCYLIVVWTSWKMHPMVWRFWWVSFVAAVTGTHIVWLRMAAAVDRRRLMRVTVGCAVFVAAMLAGLALRTRILDGVSGAWLWAVGIGGVVSVVGSVVLWLRGLWGKKKMVPRGVKIGWVVVGQVGVIYAAFYLGRVTSPPAVLFERGPSGLARVAVKDLNLQVGTDLARLRRIISPGLEELEGKAMALVKQISDRRAKGSADRYLPEEENLVRGQFMSYLAYRDALLRLVAMYAGFESVEDPGARARCMVVGYAAGAMVFEASAKMVALFKNDAMVRGKLNEADARWV
ncbi:MAG: hypothetical protein NTU53_20845 [Planctomycetota bacterium]|nr:hypothetical protein [Planctomycetota bacterium]